MTAITTEQRAADAMFAWSVGARRRRIAATFERAADAALAGGGIVLANATMPLELGLPVGRPGIALGMTLLTAGAAWIVRMRPRRVTKPMPAIEARAAMRTEAVRAA